MTRLPDTFMHRDVEIAVNAAGFFVARVDSRGEPVDICQETIGCVRKEIDRILSRERNRRERPSIPVYLYNGATLTPLEWRGFQSNTGAMLVTHVSGKKQRLKIDCSGNAYLLPSEMVDDEVLCVVQRYEAAQKERAAASEALKMMVQERGVELPTSWELSRDSEQHELAIRGKLEEMVRRARIGIVNGGAA